jgi:hypothetical protein
VSVPFTVSGTATPGADYTLLSASPLVIPAGSLTGTISLSVVPDALAEPNETVLVSMGTPSGAVPGVTTVHTATIVDAPLICASFEGTYRVRRENEPAGQIVVKLSQAAGSSVAVPFTVSGTATRGIDYTISPSPVVIPAGSLTGQIAVTLVDDQNYEPIEDVTVVLANPAFCPSAMYVVYIRDDDLPSVEFTAATQGGRENVRTMTIEARLSAAAADPVSVTYALDGTATPGAKADYTIAPSPLVIPAGSLAASLTVKVNNDKIRELDETVIVTMTSATNANLGSLTQHTATILDDEPPPQVSFTAQRQSLTEEAAAVTVTARLSAVPLRPVTVPFTLGGTATPGSDYVAPAGPLTIPAGLQEGTVVMTVREDALDEADETLTVTMGTPANAVLGKTKVQTVTIRDDDPYPSVAFTAESQSCLESAGTLAIAVQLSEVSGQEVQVSFRLSGTARKGATRDYTVAPGKLTIPAGSAGAEILVTVNNDVLPESDETIIVTLTKPVRATLGAMAKHTVTIRDDDGAPVPTVAAASYVTAPAAPAEAATPPAAVAPAFSAPVALSRVSPEVPAAVPGAAPAPVRRLPSSAEEAGPLDRELEALLEEIAPALVPH